MFKPVDGSGGKGIVIGPQADDEELDGAARKVPSGPARTGSPRSRSRLSTVPTLVGGRLAPRHVDLRPFAVNDGDRVWVLPGGLTRVALPEGELVVNSCQGGGSKDTWVLTSRPRPAAADEAPELLPRHAAGRRAGPGPPTEQAQQQQQRPATGRCGADRRGRARVLSRPRSS